MAGVQRLRLGALSEHPRATALRYRVGGLPVHVGHQAPAARPSLVKVAVLAGAILATRGSSGCIRRLGAALRTREKRPIASDPNKRPWPWSQDPPKSPISPRLPCRHTHGIYARTSLLCDGKPVFQQQTGAATPDIGDPREAAAAAARGDARALYLYSPSGRESWMVGRDACKPSGWLEIHTSYAAYSCVKPLTRRFGQSATCSRGLAPNIGATGLRSSKGSRACGASTCPEARGAQTRRSSCSCTRCKTPSLASATSLLTACCMTPMSCSGGSRRRFAPAGCRTRI